MTINPATDVYDDTGLIGEQCCACGEPLGQMPALRTLENGKVFYTYKCIQEHNAYLEEVKARIKDG